MNQAKKSSRMLTQMKTCNPAENSHRVNPTTASPHRSTKISMGMSIQRDITGITVTTTGVTTHDSRTAILGEIPTGTKDTRVHPEVVSRLGPKTITTTKTVAITKPVAITKTDTITKMATITKIPTPTTGHTTATTTAGTDVEDATTTTIPSKHPHWSFAAQKGEQSNSTTLQSHASQLVTIRLALSHWSCGYFRHLERDPDPCLPVQ
mmetsp:Transcript_34196/g.80532  ORF Transcript_34196/g.80532 Transcript_34196/m.80532 type:complete len:208 (-) Transcript_34196:167-790(-)